MKRFKVGDLVRIKDGTHDEKLPDSRMGLIIEEVREQKGPRRDPHRKFTSIYKLWMTNGQTLNFHEMFLEKAEKNEENEEK